GFPRQPPHFPLYEVVVDTPGGPRRVLGDGHRRRPVHEWDIYPARRSLRYERAPSRSDRGPLGSPWNRRRGVGAAPLAPRDSSEEDRRSRVKLDEGHAAAVGPPV